MVHLFLPLFFLLLFASCEHKPEIPLTDEQLLVAGPWKVVRVTEKQGTFDPNASVSETPVECNLSGTLELLSNGRINSDKPEGSCIIAPFENWSWSYVSNDRFIRFRNDAGTVSFGLNILEINEMELTLFIESLGIHTAERSVKIYHLERH